MGIFQCLSICSETQDLQLECRSSSSSSEHNGTIVESTNPICFSLIHSDRQSAAENEAGSSVGSMFDHTTVESTAVVSFGTGNVHQFSSAVSDEGRHIKRPRSKSHSLVLSGHIQLVAWRVSGILSEAKEFQTRLQA